MRRYFLTKLEIEGFRGINNDGQPLKLTFSKDKVNSVYALNGLGKSSVYDALSYAIRGRIAKLDRLQQAENPQEYYCNRFHSKQHATIELTFEADDDGSESVIRVERNQAGNRSVTMVKGAGDPEELLRSLDSDFTLLDQATFEQFIRDTPLDRGRTFAKLLGLSRLSDYRQALKKLSNNGNLTRDFDGKSLKASKEMLEEQTTNGALKIRRLYEAITGAPYVGDIDEKQVSERVVASLCQIESLKSFCAEKELKDVDFVKLRAAISGTEKGGKRESLEKVKAEIKELEKRGPIESEASEQELLVSYMQERDERLAKTQGPLVRKNYQAALEVVRQESWNNKKKCPTCDTNLDVNIEDALSIKLKDYADADAASKQVRKTWEDSSWSKRLRDLEAASGLNVTGEERKYAELKGAFETGYASAEQFNVATKHLHVLEKKRTRRVEILNKERDKLERELPASVVAAAKTIGDAETVGEELAEHRRTKQKLSAVLRKLDRRRAWSRFVKNAHQKFSQAESRWAENRQEAISSDYQDMHASITRNPDVVPILEQPSDDEKVFLKLKQFYGLTGLSANTLLQESYCNSVAISVFLSTALKCRTPARFIVLDDITSSFDAGHQYNLMEVLRSQVAPPFTADGPQVILLTHDTLLEKYLDKAQSTHAWRHQKLLGTPPSGPVLTELHDVDHVRTRAKDFLATGQTEDAKPWIRQYLESVLSRVIRKVGISVPVDYAMNDSRKQVQHAIDAIKKDITLHKDSACLVLTQQQFHDLSNTLLPALVGNWCAHYDTAAYAGLSGHFLSGVLDDVDRIAACFKFDCSCRQPGHVQQVFYRDLKCKGCKC